MNAKTSRYLENDYLFIVNYRKLVKKATMNEGRWRHKSEKKFQAEGGFRACKLFSNKKTKKRVKCTNDGLHLTEHLSDHPTAQQQQ